MSDIAIEFSWIELMLIFGWPGLILGGIAGAMLWRRRRVGGAVVGALIGFIAWFAIAFLLKLA